MIHAPSQLLAALGIIARDAGVSTEFVCGVAATEFGGLPYDQRRGLVMEYFCSNHGPMQELVLDVQICKGDTGRGMSPLQTMLTAMWVFADIPEAVSLVVAMRGF